MNKTRELDLRMLFFALVQKLWLIVLCVILVGAAAYGVTSHLLTPMYRASVSIYVNNNKVNLENGAGTITYSDLSTASRLVSTYVTILESDRVLNKVAEELDTPVAAQEIRAMISAEAIDETEVFQVQISNEDPVLAAEIANAIAAVAPEEIEEIVVGSATKIIDHAVVPTEPYSPNVIRNTILGAAIGAVVAMVIIAMQVLLDVYVRDETDIAKLSDAPILGRIPDFTLDDKGGAYAAKTEEQQEEAVEE